MRVLCAVLLVLSFVALSFVAPFPAVAAEKLTVIYVSATN